VDRPLVDHAGPVSGLRPGWWGHSEIGQSADITHITRLKMRGQANMPYVFWTAAFNVSFLVGFIVLDQLFAPPAPKKRLHKPVSSSTTTSGAIMTLPRDTVANEAPPLLEAINKNGLVLFLIVGPLILPRISL
jgi:hypothetical protein